MNWINQLDDILEKYPTPVYVYDGLSIVARARELNDAFGWNRGFKNYFAVKATPNPAILQLLIDEGMGLDCSSLVELMMAQRLGVDGDDIMFTSNNTPLKEYQFANELGAIINLDDDSHIDFLADNGQLPNSVCFRYNPGDRVRGNRIIGEPQQAKFGMTKAQIFVGVKKLQENGSDLRGLHAMVISNNLDLELALTIVEELFLTARDLYEKTGIELEFINLGGGLGVAYRPDDEPFPLLDFSEGVRRLYETILPYESRIYMENGRYITGPNGYLLSRVGHLKKTYKNYAGLDASMHNLMRPGMYGAYHRISVAGKESLPLDHVYDVTGSLCENNDKFAIDRELPRLEIGDLVIIHDAGAHGHAMGFNYNGKLRSSEVLVDSAESFRLIRRAEVPEDYFSTLV